MQKWRESWIDEAIALRKEGWTLQAIGEKFNRSGERVRQVLDRARVWPTAKQMHLRVSKRACQSCDDAFRVTFRQQIYCCTHCAQRYIHNRKYNAGRRYYPRDPERWKHVNCRRV